MLCNATFAQNYRAENWETTLRLVYQDSTTITFDGGSTVELDDDIGFGFEFAYNYSPKVSFSWEWDYLDTQYRATLQPADMDSSAISYRNTMEFIDTHFNTSINFVDGPITPFIKLGIGFTYIDTNVANGPPQTGCWWHPWFGYICDTYQSSYSDWRFSYNASLGIRWAINEDIFFKASISEQWLDLNNASTPSFSKAAIELGFFY